MATVGPLNPAIFNDRRSTGPSQNEHTLEILQQADNTFVGTHTVQYIVSMPDFLATLTPSRLFYIDIEDAC